MLYYAFQSARHPKSASSMGHLHPHVIRVPWIHLTHHPKLHLDRFSHFLHNSRQRVPILYNVR